MGNTLPKRILKMKGLTMKQKWAMHKRGTKPKSKSRGISVKNAKKWVKKQWGLGRMIHGGRVIDVLTRPMQWAHLNGTPGKFVESSKYLYGAGAFGPEGYDKNVAKSTYGEMGTGLGVSVIKSKAGVYRGAGKGKILSVAQAVSEELLAASKVSPLDDIAGFNNYRRAYSCGASDDIRGWSLDPKSSVGKLFWQDKAFNVVLGLIQKGVFNTNGPIGLNKYLPKGVNF